MREKSEVVNSDRPVSFDKAYVEAKDRVLDPTRLEADSFERLPFPT